MYVYASLRKFDLLDGAGRGAGTGAGNDDAHDAVFGNLHKHAETRVMFMMARKAYYRACAGICIEYFTSSKLEVQWTFVTDCIHTKHYMKYSCNFIYSCSYGAIDLEPLRAGWLQKGARRPQVLHLHPFRSVYKIMAEKRVSDPPVRLFPTPASHFHSCLPSCLPSLSCCSLQFTRPSIHGTCLSKCSWQAHSVKHCSCLLLGVLGLPPGALHRPPFAVVLQGAAVVKIGGRHNRQPCPHLPPSHPSLSRYLLGVLG